MNTNRNIHTYYERYIIFSFHAFSYLSNKKKPRYDYDSTDMAILDMTSDEILLCCKKIGVTRDSRPDGITNKALKTIIKNNPHPFVRIMQTCLEEETFSKQWTSKKWANYSRRVNCWFIVDIKKIK